MKIRLPVLCKRTTPDPSLTFRTNHPYSSLTKEESLIPQSSQPSLGGVAKGRGGKNFSRALMVVRGS